MLTTPLWAETFAKIVDDIHNNRGPPVEPPDPNGLANFLSRLNAALPSAILFLQSHRGWEAGLADLLAAMEEYGVPHAGDIREAILAIPGLADAGEKYLPTILWGMKEFAPAPTGITGG